jgi:uncharacterized membrane protein (UPF0127 family)
MQPRKNKARGVSRRSRLPLGLLLGVTWLASTFSDGLAAAADEDFPRSALEIRSAHGRQWFNIRIADTDARQELGLMFQTRLSADEGMLFPQAQPRIVTMWMKNTYIPLDMLFIDRRGRIVCLLANTRPQSLEILSCPKPVKAVLEIGGGEARERGIRVGDRVIHRYFKPAP